MTAKRKSATRGVSAPKVLAVDIGGKSIKFLATAHTEPRKAASGPKLTAARMVELVSNATADWKYDAVAIGYPGLVGASGPIAEPGNLGGGWVGFDFAAAFGRPVRIVNDATMQALGSYDGGRMLFLGFGTGVGSVLIVSHTVVPLELGELKWKGRTFAAHFGHEALEEHGEKRWRKRVLDTLPSLQRAFLADYLVIGGGNSKYLLEPLPPNVRIGHNLTAFRGGYRLWGIDELPDSDPARAAAPAKQTSEWRLL